MSNTIPVYEWQLDNGTGFGCGTKVEFDYWTEQGVNPAGAKLGAIIAYEPASEDERRAHLWAKVAA